MFTHAHPRRGLIGTLVAGLVATPLALGFTPAQADVSTKITPAYTQDWSDAGLITANDVWTNVPGVQGYLGTELTSAQGADPQTLTGDGSATTDVVANAAVTATNGGVLEVPGTIAIQGSGAATAPHVVFHLDLTGKTGTTFAFNAKDLDASADDAVQQIAVQYRVGAAGAYTNAPTGYIADATTANATTQVTARSVALPAATDNQASVFVRVVTTNAVGNDELVGIDDINISNGPVAPGPLAATDPGDKNFTVNQAITPFTLTATGGTPPVTWTSTPLPAGLVLDSATGTISGTPTATGTTTVTATATDAATPTAGTSQTVFDITVAAAGAITPIAQIQGTGPATPIPAATPVTTEGVVTGVFSGSSATNGGIYIQTGGTGGANDATPGASDGLYVFGGNAQPAGVDVGDSVRVTGPVSEFGTLTQITPAAGGVSEIAALPAVTAAAIAYPTSDTGREAHESELLAPTGPFTVSNVFNITGGANAFAEIGLASGTTPLKQPTDFADASDTAAINAITAENAERAVALDDGSSVNYATSPGNALPLPWISGNTNPPRVGAPATFTAPVVLDYRNSTWKFQPTLKITGDGAATATFGNDRAQNAAPANVGGDLKISTFNVLNYFPTTGQAHVAAGGTCTYFNDRAGNPIANNSCNPNGPRGAATQASFLRQQEKIVDAINKLGASVVSLEELENSIKMIGQTDRDNAIRTLVTALNAAPGVPAGTWAFAPSPPAADLPTPAQEDVIRTGFIYKPADVTLVGPSVVLKDEVNFDNAREPLAQAFRPVGGDAASTFGVIVNHFKSKGSACAVNDPIQGNCNEDRVGQAEALRDFAATFRTARSLDDLFLVGDFNSYTQEDPMQVLYAAGYDNVVSDDASDASYSFNGLAGSLDHVLGNAGAIASVTGSDIWEINANESLAYQYSRYNYHGELYHGVNPWSSSDHNPEVVGIDVPAAAPTATVVADDKTIVPGRDTTVPVTVTGTGGTPTGTVTVTNGATTVGTATLTNGAATVSLNTKGLAKGTYTLTVTYNGDATYAAATDTFVLTVAEPATRTIQILGTNDFHGRLLNNAAGAPGTATGTPAGSNTSVDQQAGAAILAGAVKQLRGQNPDTVFAAAGDLIGASTFESFIQNDNPTIDALNEAGLEVSAAGNHEFDAGYEDLVGRVQNRANWEYIAANVNEPPGRDDLAESWTKQIGDVTVGFVGAVTEDLPSLVSPAGIQGVTVTDIVDATNAEANALKAGGADLIVLLVHEGAPSVDCATMDDDPTSAFGSIITGVNANVDAIISGHTHMLYNCSFPVPGKSVERPVVSAGQYGTNLNKLEFTVDTATGAVQAKTQSVLPLKLPAAPFTAQYPADPATTTIVANAITAAAGPGSVVVGKIAAPFSRAKFANGVENRGGESTLGNLVAEIQRYATRNPESGSAQIAFMNPGGLRADLAGTAAEPGRSITYREAANVQPFANTLVNMKLTGAQIETVLEQQWQTTTAGGVPSRPFLKLGQSNGFEYTYYTFSTPRTDNPSLNRTAGEVTSMQLNGVELVPTQTYSVTVNSFLASGGDNFRELNNGAQKRDTGKADLQAQVDYFEEVVVGANSPLAVDYSQRAVGATFPDQADTTYRPGETVTFNLSSLIMTGIAGGVNDLKDSVVEVRLGTELLGTYTVDQTVPSPAAGTTAENASNDEAGKATVTFVLPANAPGGVQNLKITGPTTGTEVQVPITVERFATTVTGVGTSVGAGEDSTITVTVDAAGTEEFPTGSVEVLDSEDNLVGTVTLVQGVGQVVVPASALTPGDNVFTLNYLGQGEFDPSTGTATIAVAKSASTVTGTADPVTFGNPATVIVTVAGDDDFGPATGTVQLLDGSTVIGSVELVDGTGNITVPASALETGSNVFTLSYGGDANYAASTGSVTVPVTKINAQITGTVPQITYGQAGQLTVTVGSNGSTAPVGTVTVTRGGAAVGTVTLTNGTGTLALPAKSLAPGTYTLDLVYSGDANYTTATGTASVTVVKADSTVAATVTPARPVVGVNGSRFAVTVTAPGFTPGGGVELRRAGVLIGSGTLNAAGQVVITTAVWRTVGTQSIQVRYLGDANANASAVIKSFAVVKQTPTMAVKAPAKAKKGARPQVTVGLKATGITVTGRVSFTFNGKTVTKTVSGQKAILKLPKLNRTTKVTVKYLGTGQLNAVTKSVTIRVTR